MENDEITLLKNQCRQLKKYAEKMGSESASWKHKYIRLLEEYDKLKTISKVK